MLLTDQEAAGRIVGAICAAPTALLGTRTFSVYFARAVSYNAAQSTLTCVCALHSSPVLKNLVLRTSGIFLLISSIQFKRRGLNAAFVPLFSLYVINKKLRQLSRFHWQISEILFISSF